MNSIRLKLVVICVFVLLIVMMVSGTFMLLRVRNNEIVKSRGQLANHAEAINELFLQVYDEPSQYIEAFENWDVLTKSPYDIQGCILNALGKPIAAPFKLLQFQFNDSAVVSAIAGEVGFSTGKKAFDLNGTEQEWLCYAVPVMKNDAKYIIFTRMSAKPMNDNLSQLTVAIILMVILAVLMTGSLWFVFANTLTEPIVALTRHAKALAAGNLQREISVFSKDEIGQLTQSFNHMAKELHTTVSTIASEKNKSEAILHNMTDGILAYDASGKIIHVNSASTELLQIEDFEDFNTLSLSDMLSKLGLEAEEVYKLTPEMVRESTFLVGDRYVTATITPYPNQAGSVDGYVIVLQDVTKHTKLDIMRKEFVANVSHELRTPLTSIQTYTETLLEGAINDPAIAEQFLHVIDNETQRMSLLVTDLLELSRLDNNQLHLDLEVVDLSGLVKLVITQNRLLADKKDQQVVFDPPNKPYFIEADVRRVNQALTNILTNSIKYSPESTSIEISMEETDRYFRVFISDHGIGIPKEDLSRIFERFYRVDKARSRAMGGTGLGLAIAREIMEKHGGRIFVSSELGSGTTMVLRFDKYKEQELSR